MSIVQCLTNVTIALWILTAVAHGSELFTSTDRLRDLALAEDIVIPEMTEVVTSLKERIQHLKSLVAKIKHNQSNSTDDIVDNPVQVYHLTKRWFYIYTLFSNQFIEDQHVLDLESNEHEDEVVDNIAAPYNDDDDDDEDGPSFDCKDNDSDCKKWASRGECKSSYADYMKDECRLSCKICTPFTIRDNADKKFQELFNRLIQLSGTRLPTYNDYDGSVESLLRLQRTYDLEGDDLFVGNIRGYKSKQGLNVEDCYHLGRKAYEIYQSGYAIHWLKKAKQLNTDTVLSYNIAWKLAQAYTEMGRYQKSNETLSSLNKEQPLDITSSSCYDISNMCQRLTEYNVCEMHPGNMAKSCAYYCKPCGNISDNVDLEPLLTNTISDLKHKLKVTASTGEELFPQREFNPQRYTYEALCRGEGTVWYPEAVCRYRPAGLAWNCYKEEILSMNPRISMVYDVIDDMEANMLITKAKHLMSRGLVGSKGEYSNDRISNVGWLEDDDEFIRKLSERVEMITGLEVTLTTYYDDDNNRTSSDEFQAVNYGIGGYYEPHEDYFTGDRDVNGTDMDQILQLSGDRIATFLLYLTDVKAGGATVYPKVRVHVPPIKNAAAFWFNAHMSGKYDPMTEHAGCPVLLGEKWVCNKWPREYGNEFKRKCGLTKDAGYS